MSVGERSDLAAIQRMIDYKSILSASRLRTSTRRGRTTLTESESDRGRVLFSPAFRRLQQKAQVFSMEPNAAVRSRLTHSLEVSQLGRFLTDEICQRIDKRKARRLDAISQGALVNFVETACLMHDIGNPPFGHFGEAAIQEWFKRNGERCLAAATGKVDSRNKLLPQFEVAKNNALADFLEFDGNPQGLRIVARLQWNADEFGLNLTKTSLASFLKYIRSPVEEKASTGFRKKPGYFLTEADVVLNVWNEFGYSKPQRFPLTYIMEAADDIAYCVSDLEDSFEKRIVDKDSTFREIAKNYARGRFSPELPCHLDIVEALKSVRAGKLDGKAFTYTDFRTRINNSIVRYAADQYLNNEKSIAKGQLETLLPENEPAGYFLDVLKKFCRDHVYNHVSVQRVELAGYNAIVGLLNQFEPLLTASRSRFLACLEGRREDGVKARILLEPKFLKLFPERYLKVYKHHLDLVAGAENPDFVEWNARAHLVTDFISGMTDDFAMNTYRTLAGMEL